ncbi:hypothetical protein A2422_03990 [Candidatus Woesebacteria bacterium RIFOXYC1_FULL_31_51]|uniref:Uncharacterized protein n=1 Tax=Candidatus Woesebacteria bacterium GW2011_GWC2_31_9 TaxID=1618586 RepID=A0A0G0AZN6_9BACT|nr:MAG: hypothetical protein UR17_C0001G0305 [Candidatus Woesebacteria bacterium GW2011_GWF1_31_35]KKP23201.1 MAG: hypothetical protein UR11_C0001G0175 [Candidatus Woesebacteria bacterium GW2011_GWC1_30_29]KKP26889.1 MAG: hypothetical protein UR13_C0002G0124 [Candidatus Woesebacteria bacterium GW2011_GWD1_31_12]KKP27463.1 MAG: hypothetical protein UR16_C0003G0123 [Candidatus Woesebacteria bacterium GW2011_GWB1_31_29]KKP31121.1 MAG: hypothetical protein UR20_C0043G0004 [Candidatus Woesebacteria 
MLSLSPGLDDIEDKAGISVSSVFNKPADIIIEILPYVYGIAGIILLLNIIVSGYQMMTSAGEPKVMQAAQSKITSSIIGILILFVSFWIIRIIGTFFGIDIFNQMFGTQNGVDLLPPVI